MIRNLDRTTPPPPLPLPLPPPLLVLLREEGKIGRSSGTDEDSSMGEERRACSSYLHPCDTRARYQHAALSPAFLRAEGLRLMYK